VASHGGGQGSHDGIMWNVSILRIVEIILGKPKSLQVEKDKVLVKVIVSVIYRIMSLTGKDIGGALDTSQDHLN
jgi:hypothetical protein